MASEVIMPQMGESIAEGTITKWLKKVGDSVEHDEPLFEISTDKVDAEIPAPQAGTLLEILVGEGETVEINTVVARIGTEDGAGARGATEETPKPSGEAPAPQETASPSAKPRPKSQAPAKSEPTPSASQPAPKGPASKAERIRTKSSPVVRKIAAEHGIDISSIQGSGIQGRVTKRDILAYVEEGGAPAAASAQTLSRAPAPAFAAQDGAQERVSAESGSMLGVSAWPAKKVEAYLSTPGENDTVETLSQMRKKIAEHMVISKALSPHVHSLYEVDMSRVDELRKAHRDEFIKASGGAKLSYTVFMVKAVVDALRVTPVVNASVLGDEVIYHNDINVGLAVALEQGLIVPVIRRAQDLSMTGIARAINDLATRARNRQLELGEIQGSTFSITNPGSFGGLIGFPVISQPNVAILGMGTVEKRVCVVNDAIAIRPKMYMTLGYDHRLVDGATAEVFLSSVKKTLENFDETAL
jgi:2-oxoglutarate dehydrogenase E2 component (dihydrolipoamide succinyltransferase)